MEGAGRALIGSEKDGRMEAAQTPPGVADVRPVRSRGEEGGGAGCPASGPHLSQLRLGSRATSVWVRIHAVSSMPVLGSTR